MKTYLVSGPNGHKFVAAGSAEEALKTAIGVGQTFTMSEYKVYPLNVKSPVLVSKLVYREKWDAYNHDYSEVDIPKDLFLLFKKSKVITTRYHNELTEKVVFNCILQGGNSTGEKILARIDGNNMTARYATYIFEQYDSTEWDEFKNAIKNQEANKN